jgi:thymidylate synthase ThyX
MTQFIWTGSLLAFINLYNQRLAPDAQQETQQAAQMMLDAVKQTGKFTHSLKAHGYV